jgi:hypothetical protein
MDVPVFSQTVDHHQDSQFATFTHDDEALFSVLFQGYFVNACKQYNILLNDSRNCFETF